MSKTGEKGGYVTGIKPQQRVGTSVKDKDDKAWYKANGEYYLSLANFYTTTDSTNSDLYLNYRIYNNDIPQRYFHYVTNPFNTSGNNKTTNFPARIRPYNIIRPNIDLYLGEYIKRPFKYTIVNTSEEAANEYLQGLKSAIYSNVRQHYILKLVNNGQISPEDAQGLSPEDLPMPDEIERQFKQSYTDLKAEKALGALKQAEKELRIHDVWLRCFDDYLKEGKCTTYKSLDPTTSEFIYQRINPIDVKTDMSPDDWYGENGSYTVRRMLVNVADVVDLFYDHIEESEIDSLEENITSNNSPASLFSDLAYTSQEGSDVRDKFYIYHIVWKGLEKVGILSYIDEFGQPSEMLVDESYKPEKELGETVEWVWRTCWHETWKVDKYFMKSQKCAIQRNKLNYLSSNKSPYNTVYYSNENSKHVSPVSLGIPYQILYIILCYRIEMTIAKSKGSILFFNSTLIGDEVEDKEGDFIQFSEATGWGMFDPSKVGASQLAGTQPYFVADMSLFKDIAELIKIKDSVAGDYDELLGITRQRKGNVSASDSVGGTQIATIQSSTVSEYLFKKFEGFKEVELQGILDHVKYAYTNGTKGMYLNDSIRQELLMLDEGDFENSELGIHLTTNAKDNLNVEHIKQLAQSFAQNGTKASTIAEVFQKDTIAEITSILKQAEEVEQKIAERNAQFEGKNNKELEQLKGEIEKDYERFKHDLEVEASSYDHDRLDNREILKGEIELNKVQLENGLDTTDVDTALQDIEKNALERDKQIEVEKSNKKSAQQKDRELDIKEKDIEAKKYASDISLKIAKENKNKFDK